MALVQARKSDKSGLMIPEGSGARIRIEFYDGKTTARRADLTTEEVEELLCFAQVVETRPARRRSRADL
jgi:transposase